MKVFSFMLILFLLATPQNGSGATAPDWLPPFMAISGAGIATIWIMDIISGDKVDPGNGYLLARESGTDSFLFPHWVAEYSTAALLLAGAYGLHNQKPWGRDVSLTALGTMAYTSTNSLGWALGRRERLPYAIPMLFCLTGSGVSLVVLL